MPSKLIVARDAARRQLKRQRDANIKKAKADHKVELAAALQAEDDARAAARAEPQELVDLRNKRERAYRKLEKLDAAIAKYEKSQQETRVDKRSIEQTYKRKLDELIAQYEDKHDADRDELDTRTDESLVLHGQARARKKYDAIHNKLKGMSTSAVYDDSYLIDPKFATKREGYELALKDLHSELSAEDLASALRKEESIRETFGQCRRDMDRYNNSMAIIEARAAQDQAEYEAKLKAEQEQEQEYEAKLKAAQEYEYEDEADDDLS